MTVFQAHMHDPLAPLLHDGVIDEVLGRLKSGKEADLWLVRHGEEVIAAKVYKARDTRSFKNNAAYKEGRQVRNSRTQRAMDRGSRFGQAAAEEAWKVK
jgi:RIO kinase 1